MYVFNNQIHSLFHYNLFILAASIPLRIREARVPIVHDNECVRKINSVTEKIFILPTSSFCAGGEKGHDACQVKCFNDDNYDDENDNKSDNDDDNNNNDNKSENDDDNDINL